MAQPQPMTATIFRPPVPNEQEQCEVSEIARRRERFAERTTRILNAKERQFGKDTRALAEQVRTRQENEELERQRDLYYDQQSNEVAKVRSQMESLVQLEKKERDLELKNFRYQQVKEKRRKEQVESSNLPDQLQMETPFLKFAGEDQDKRDRDVMHQQMQQQWLAQQVQLMQDRNAFEQAEDANRQAKDEHVLEMRYKVEQQCAMERRKRNEEQKVFNQRLAIEKREREQQQREHARVQEEEELRNQLQSQFLNEGVNPTHGPKGFKGFTTAQKQRILDERAQQVAELEAKRDVEWRAERSYDVYQEQVRQAGMRLQHEQNVTARKAKEDLSLEQRKQQREKEQRYNYLDQVVYTNPVKEVYFQQFQQSSY